MLDDVDGGSMKQSIVLVILLATLTITSSMAGCLFNDDDTNSDKVTAVFSYSPNQNMKQNETINFDASSSLPNDGSLTYRWDFDGDNAVDKTGKTPSWSYTNTGDYDVTLTVSDGNTDSQLTKTITILGADAIPPSADPGEVWAEVDCDDEDSPTQSAKDKYLYYICEDKGENDREIDASTNVMLDASESEAGNSQAYISQWSWDLDVNTDSDGDGDPENDEDATGETHEWKNIIPGEYELSLKVKNSEGMIDMVSFKVYVNYVGIWEDFNQPANTSAGNAGGPGETWFDFTVTFDSDTGNTIKRTEVWLTYPKEDDDWIAGGSSDSNRNRLDLYVYNDTDEEVGNTSGIELASRTYGDCSDENDCLEYSVSGSRMRSEFDDGDWTVKIYNGNYNDVQVVEFRILLTYK